MATDDHCYWLSPSSRIEYVDSATAPTIHLRDADGSTAELHLNAGELIGAQGKRDAVRVLDALAAACIAAYKALQALDVAEAPAVTECNACAARKRNGGPGPIAAGCASCESWRAYRSRLTGRDVQATDDDDDEADDAIAAHELVSPGSAMVSHTLAEVAGRCPITYPHPRSSCAMFNPEAGNAAHELVRVPVGTSTPCARCGHAHSQVIAPKASWCAECPCFVFVSPTAPVTAENELRALAGDR